MKKKFLSMLIVSAVAVTAMGCSNNTNESSKSAASSNTNVSVSDSSDESASADVKAKITLSNNSISAEGDGVEVVDKTITINSGGTYEVSGTLEDGQIIVDSADEINITSGGDGIQAETTLTISDGDINIVSGGGSSNAATHTESFQMGPWANPSNISTSSRNDTESAKGLKAGTNLTVNGGNNSGSESNGLYTDGIATSGTELTNFTLSSSVMTVSSTGATEGVSGGMRAPGGMGGMQGGGRPPR